MIGSLETWRSGRTMRYQRRWRRRMSNILLNSHSHLTYGNLADKPSLESLIVSLTKNV
jgi:aryl carrier-like protein